MSGKQAKRERRALRAAGIEPRVDAKRRRLTERYEEDAKRRAELEAFKRDHPEEHYEHARRNAERFNRTIGVLCSALVSMSTPRIR